MSHDRPHVVRIVAHDAGQHLGCYGIDTVETPNLNRLAAEGVRFENSFCVAPQCSPSRASMMTGRYPHQNGVMGLTHGQFAWDLHDDEQHMAALLSDAGWHSACAGIHHAARDEAAFDEVLGDDEMGSSAAESGTCLGIADGAGTLIERHADADEPLNLHVGFFEPHREPPNPGNFPEPLDPDDYADDATIPDYLVDEPSARDEFRAFEAAVRRMDAGVGQVLDALDDAGIADETVVLATTDHGIPFPRAKCSPYDAGLETFCIARWPEGLPAGVTYEPPITTVDHLPTLFDWLDVPVLDAVEGVSHAAAIAGRGGGGDSGTDAPRDVVFGELTHHDYTDPRRAIRADGYKCIVNFSSAPFFMDPSQDHRPGTITRDPEFPKMAYHPPVELYALADDPHEEENLAEDPAHAETLESLLGRLHDWMRDTDDPLLDGIPTPPMHDAALASLEAERSVHPQDIDVASD
jgi:N-sulfoglucosamine sulfohydrolase